MKSVVALVLFLFFYTSTTSGLKKHERRKQQSRIPLEHLLKLETEEVLKGEHDAFEAEAASVQNDPNTAAHKFGLGAERIEAAKNDAEIQKTTFSEKRKEREHQLAQRLEQLAEENREDSALQDGNLSSDDNRSEQEPPIINRKVSNSKAALNELARKRSRRKFVDLAFLTNKAEPDEEAEIQGSAGWGADVANPEAEKTEEQLKAEGLSNSTSSS